MGAVALAVLAWGWMIVAAPLWLAYAVLVLRLRPLGLAPPGDWLHLAAWPAGLVSLFVLEAAGAGPVDRYGDRPVAFAAGFAIMALLWAFAQVSLGRRLLAEEPLHLSTAPWPGLNPGPAGIRGPVPPRPGGSI